MQQLLILTNLPYLLYEVQYTFYCSMYHPPESKLYKEYSLLSRLEISAGVDDDDDVSNPAGVGGGVNCDIAIDGIEAAAPNAPAVAADSPAAGDHVDAPVASVLQSDLVYHPKTALAKVGLTVRKSVPQTAYTVLINCIFGVKSCLATQYVLTCRLLRRGCPSSPARRRCGAR